MRPGEFKELSDHYFSINAKDLTTAFNKSTKAEILKSLVDREKSAKGEINMNGTILGIVDKRIVYQNNSTKPNRNIFVVGDLDHIRPNQSSLPTCLTKRRTALS